MSGRLQNLRFPLLVAGVCLYVDIFFVGLPFLGMLVAAGLAIQHGFACIQKRRAGDGAVGSSVQKAIVYAVVFLLIPGVYVIRGHFIELGVQRTIIAVEEYHRDYGAYPSGLEDLIPDYLPEQPSFPESARMRYIETEDFHALRWEGTGLFPQIYHFERKRQYSD